MNKTLGLSVLSFLGLTTASAFAEPAQPNIIIYMVDDLGWNHIGVDAPTMGTHGKQYVTPHLANFAKEGLSFTHAYAQPNCAPTRAAMLSGQYPARIHNDVYVVGNLNRNGKGGISKDKAKFIGPRQSEDVAAKAVTIAEALKKNGYATAHIGKYHVGGHKDESTMPENVGFDIIRVPLIVRWPGKIPAGTVSHRKIHCLDFYPTCLQLAGDRWKPSRDNHPLDGDPFTHVLHDPDTTEKRDPVFYLFPGYMDSRAQPTVVAIDDLAGKRYKSFYYYEADAWELYCLTDDPGETKNVIAEQLEVAKAMSQKIHGWLTQKHPTWQPKYPIAKKSGKPAGPPGLLK